jgi:hypothetical protein
MKKRRREKIKEAKFKGKSGRRKDNKKRPQKYIKRVKVKNCIRCKAGDKRSK